MCSILFSTKELDNFDYVNERLKLRGPDHTEILSIEVIRAVAYAPKAQPPGHPAWRGVLFCSEF